MIHFPLSLALNEVARNIKSAPVRSLIIFCVALCVGAGVSLSTITDVTRVTQAQDKLYISGSAVLILSGPNGDPVPAARCHAISAMDGVESAGGVMSTEMIRLSTLPSSNTRLRLVTPGYFAATWPTLPRAHQLSVVADVSHRDYGWTAGTNFRYTDSAGREHTAKVDAVAAHPDVEQSGRTIAAVSPPHGTVTSCNVLTKVESKQVVASALRGWFGEGTSLTDALMSSGLAADPQIMFSERLSKFGWILGGAVLTGLMVMHWVARRSEFALYRLNHVSSRGIVAMFALETLFLVLLPAQIGSMFAIGLNDFTPLLGTTVLLDVLRLDLVIVLIPLIGLLAVPKGSLLATLKGQ